MSTTIKKYFDAGTPIRWSASAEKYFPQSGELVLLDDKTLNVNLEHNFSYDYWVVFETRSEQDLPRQLPGQVRSKNYGTITLENLTEIGPLFYGVRKSDYPDLQWDKLVCYGGNRAPSVTQVQVDFGNQNFTTFPIEIRIFSTISVGDIVYYDKFYMFGGNNIQEYNGIEKLHSSTLKIFSRIPDGTKFGHAYSIMGLNKTTRTIYIQDPIGLTDFRGMFAGLYYLSNVNFEDFDFSNVTNMSSMFAGVTLSEYPFFDTHRVTSMRSVFNNDIPGGDGMAILEGSLPNWDTSNVTDMGYMFSKTDLYDSLPNWDTSNVTDMNGMFEGTHFHGSLLAGEFPNWDTSNVTNMRYMFSRSTIKTAPNWNTSKVTETYEMFNNCSSLTSVPQLDTSNVTDARYMFYNCTKLTTCGGFIGLKVDLDMSACPLTHDSAMNIINNLATVTTTRTLTLNSTTYSALTYRERYIAIEKGWTVATK